MKFAINNVRVIDPKSPFHQKKVSLLIEKGEIVDVAKKAFDARKSIDGDDLYVSPAWCDLRVHLKDPGNENQETLQQTLNSAAKGGFTSFLSLPDTIPPVDNKNGLFSIKHASEDSIVDILPMACLSKQGKGDELSEMLDLHNEGAFAFGDGDLDNGHQELLGHALLYIQKFNGLIIQHAEEKDISQNGQVNEGELSTRLGLKGIPNLAEYSAVNKMIDLLEHYGGRLHLSHISTPESLDLIRKAKKKGLKLSCDISYHHLVLDESVLSAYESNYKMNPPLRTKKEIKEFWKAIADDTIDAIVSDHNPKDPESKDLEFDLADFGVIGLETLFPALMEFKPEKISLEKVIEKISYTPREILNIENPKIDKGEKANLTVFGLNNPWKYEIDISEGRAMNSPYLGQTFKSRVLAIVNKGDVFINI